MANGCEAATDTDTANCGRCGNACPEAPNAAPLCDLGTCRLTCASGFRDCDGDPGNGCEAAIGSDVANCGRCGVVCPGPSDRGVHVRGSSCAAGACVIVCDAGWGDCNRVASDGCEVNLTTSSDCGTCARSCAVTGLAYGCCVRSGAYRCCRGIVGIGDICGGGVIVTTCD
jgi:hypothetical protein